MNELYGSVCFIQTSIHLRIQDIFVSYGWMDDRETFELRSKFVSIVFDYLLFMTIEMIYIFTILKLIFISIPFETLML